MNINLLKICKELLENNNIIELNNNIFFKSKDDYKKYCLDLLKNKLNNILNKPRISISQVNKIQKVYCPDNNGTIDNLLLLDYNKLAIKNLKLLKGDLLEINNNYVLVDNINSDFQIEVQFIKYKKINLNDNICKIVNLKKYNRIYNSIQNSNKFILRNLLNPNLFLTKLSNPKIKSEFWNDDQKNAIYNLTKNTENKKIHLIEGPNNTGKTTLLLGVLQNINSRFENLNFLIINGNKNLNKLVNKLKIQQNILIPNKWFMIIGDNNFLDKQLHEYTITNYINEYINSIANIENYVIKMENSNHEKNLLFSKLFEFIKNVINNLPIVPFHNNKTILEIIECNKNNYIQCVNEIQFILNKWKYTQFINNVLIEKCNIIISTICSSGCSCFEIYKPDIIIIDDAEKLGELDILIPIKDITQKLLLFYNYNKLTNNSFVNRLILGGCNIHKLNQIF